MAVSRAFRIMPIVLAQGVLTPILSPMNSVQRVMISASTTDVEIHTNENLQEGRLLITGFERLFNLAITKFRSDETAFWLKSPTGGTVILEWF